ncbi:MAG TPA: hypothetical protein VJ875_15200 [Pyrinomonadaceae bacterium]|nr:hypothetical protein [Pyrinomonadaceae bacterium]
MPAKRLKLGCGYIFTLMAVLSVPAGVEAQTGSVTLRAAVSETVALSVLPNFTQGDVTADVVGSGNTVRITLSGTDVKDPVIRVPLLVRSNTGFRISAAVESTTATLSQLSITDIRRTGRLVSPAIVSELNVTRHFDLRGLDENPSTVNPLDLSRPLLVATGPRVSLGGTLDSAGNALQITVLIRLRPQSTGRWLVHLTFVGTAESLIQ